MTVLAFVSRRGFSLVELLVALTICAIVSAGVAIVVPPARVLFESVPAELELHQRARAVVEAMAPAIRAAGGEAVVANDLGPFKNVVPALIPYDSTGNGFTALKVIRARVNAAQGVLDRHQSGAAGALFLAASPCPDASLLCGFTRGATALITDGSGRFDAFTVASIDAGAGYLIADRAFVLPYAAGSIVVEADVDTFQLEAQPDGSSALVRVSAAGAVQPLVDRVNDLAFELFAFDDAGRLIALPPGVLSDGPWLRGDPGGSYDEDVFRIRYVEVALTLRIKEPPALARSLRFGVVPRNVR